MPLQIEQSRWTPPDGSTHQTALTLEQEEARLVVLPEHGAKIVSLFHIPTAKEWLWLNPYLPWRTPSSPGKFVEKYDLGGWDECFPTVASTMVSGVTWPDHGDLWWRPWQVETRERELWMGVEGDSYRFERVITSSKKAGSGFRFSYTVQNLSEDPLPYLWCAHPLFRSEPPLQVEIMERPRVLLGSDSVFGQMGDTYRWPNIQGRSLDSIGKPSGLAAKFFIEMKEGRITLCTLDGAQLEMRWPLNKIPLLGFWLNEEGWSGAGVPPYSNIGIEPASGAPDDLAVALNDWECAQTLPPGKQDEWWLEVRLNEA